MNFCITNTEDGRKSNIFSVLYFIISRKAKKICAVCGESAVTTCQRWFAKYCAGDLLLDSAPRLGRPIEVDSEQVKTLRTVYIKPYREIDQHIQNSRIKC